MNSLEICQQAWLNQIPPSTPGEYDNFLPLLCENERPSEYSLAVTWNTLRRRYEAEVVRGTPGSHTTDSLAVLPQVYVQIEQTLQKLGVYHEEIFRLTIYGTKPKPDSIRRQLERIQPGMAPKNPNRLN